MRHIPCRGVSPASALAGSTNRSGLSEPPAPLDVSRAPCSPRPRGAAVRISGSPAWAMIHEMISGVRARGEDGRALDDSAARRMGPREPRDDRANGLVVDA